MVLGGYAASRLLMALAALLALATGAQGPHYGAPEHWLDLLFRWDALWYLEIARDGYAHAAGKASNAAFFPGYPMATRLLAPVLGERAAALCIPNFATIAAAWLLHGVTVKLLQARSLTKGAGASGAADDAFPRRVANRATVLFYAAPAGFFFALPYTEGLFAACFGACLWWSLHGRALAGGAAGLATAYVRPPGFLTALWLAAGALPGEKSRAGRGRWLAAAVLACAGLAGYYLTLAWTVGTPWAGIEAYAAWGRSLAWPGRALLEWPAAPLTLQVLTLASLGMAVFGLVGLARGPFPWPLWVMSAAMVLLPLSTTTLEGFPRHVCVTLPLYVGMAHRLDMCNFTAMAAVSMGLSAVGLALFAMGWWVN